MDMAMDIDAGDTARGLSDDEVLRVYAASKAQVLFFFLALFSLLPRALLPLSTHLSMFACPRNTREKGGPVGVVEVLAETRRFSRPRFVRHALAILSCGIGWEM